MRIGLVVVVLLAAGCPQKRGDDTGEPVSTSTAGETGATVTVTGGEQGPPMYCPGVPENGEPDCREQSDCTEEFANCQPYPDGCPGPGCASDCAQDSECAEDTTGGPPAICEIEPNGCCAGSGRCRPHCTEDGCDADQTCQADGHCVPTACDAGFTCPAGQVCDVGGVGVDGHGCRALACDQPGALACSVVSSCVAGVCERIACVVDDDCPCGTCIEQECWERPWICFIGAE
jgi:hypothetical protein